MDAESRYLEAFERLTSGKPLVMPVGTPVSQNNVAKEAGSDPSAFRKSRYPSLISKIQLWIKINGNGAPPSKRQKNLAQRKRNHERRTREDELKSQRDETHSKLLEASVVILEQAATIADLETRLAKYEPKSTAIVRLRDKLGTNSDRSPKKLVDR